jgi:DNA-binding SARP family transcriptional activator
MLGASFAWYDDHPVRFKTRKAHAALAYLAALGDLQPRERLAGLLWPELPGVEARTNLRVALGFLRQALGADAITATRDAVGLAVPGGPSLFLDLQALRQAQSLARSLAEAPGLRVQIEEAVALYRGAFVEGLEVPDAPEFEAWLAGQRAYWLEVTLELLERLATLQAGAGDVSAAQGTLERWVALEPGEERAWQRLLALVLERGDLVGARHAWKACGRAMADLGVSPGRALRALAAQLDAACAAPLASTAPCSGAATWGTLGELPLVGRAGPLAALRAAFVRAQSGQAQLVVLQGEAGIGKTRLAREFLAWARAQGANALMGHAFELAGNLPYAPIVAALRPLLERENAPDDLLGDLWLTELARLLPELRERYPDLPSATEDVTLGQGRLFEAVARLGQVLAARGPLVLVLDDVQWADGATRDLLHYVVPRWVESGAQALLLLVLRTEDVEIERTLAQWLGGLEREAASIRLELACLEPADVVHLVVALAAGTSEWEGPGPRDEDAVTFGRWLAGKTRGQPLYVVHLLRALVDEGALALQPIAGGGLALSVPEGWEQRQMGRLPAELRQLIRTRLTHLDTTAEEVLSAATVLDGPFSADRVFRVAEAVEGDEMQVLDHLVRRRLLREVPGTGEYTVGHALVREVLYAELGEARRRRLHQRALMVLEGENAPRAELARHALAAGLAMPPEDVEPAGVGAAWSEQHRQENWTVVARGESDRVRLDHGTGQIRRCPQSHRPPCLFAARNTAALNAIHFREQTRKEWHD